MVLVDVLDPIGKPGDRVIVNHLFPRSRSVRFRDGLMLTDVDCDILGTDAFLGEDTSGEWDMEDWTWKDLEGSFLGMFAPTSEQTRRFNAEVSNLLLATVKQTVSVRSLELVLCLLEFLLLGSV